MKMKEILIAEIERINVAILVVGSICVAIFVRDFTSFFSFIIASAIVTLNFRMLKTIIKNLLIKKIFTKKDLFIRLPLKFGLMIAAVFVVLVYGNIHPLYFLLGLSTVFFSILINQFRPNLSSDEKGRQHNGA
jgi:hypothetical protein